MPTLHIISHTHWDREWFETFQQFRLKLVRMVDDLLDLLERDPEYRHFMLDGQMIVLEDYLAMRPEREDDLRRYIQAGRMVVGPWYILPDEFLVSPEATLRNLYEGERVARIFGPKMGIGYLPDTFGHIGQMPQILRGYGFDKACAWRGIPDLPCEFWWQAPDGSRVLMAHLRESYSNARHITGDDPERFIQEVKRGRDLLAPHALSEHILLMNGDDFMVPQPRLGQAIAACGGRIDGDTLLHSTLPAYFAGLDKTLNYETLPVLNGELRSPQRSNLLPNVLSTRMWIKQRNQACQTLLEKWAEPFSTWAALAAGEDRSVPLLRNPAGALRQAWRLLLQCHPHDSICGCSIDPVHEEMRPRFDQVEQIGEEITRQSLQTLARAVDTQTHLPGVVSSVVVFNPGASLHCDVVDAAVTGIRVNEPFELLDGETPVPYQLNAWERGVLAEMTLPPENMAELLAEVNNGEIQGFRILGAGVYPAGAEAHVELVISEHGRPDLDAWARGRERIEALLEEGTVEAFHLEAIRPVKAHVTFIAQDVPGYGFKTFWVRAGEQEDKDSVVFPSRGNTNSIENEFFRVTLQTDGSLDLLDLRNGALYRGLNRFVDVGDRGDEYNFSAVEADPETSAVLVDSLQQLNPASQTLEMQLVLEIPAALTPDRQARSAETVLIPIHTRATLYPGVARLEIHTQIDNQAEDHRLRAHFPALLQAQSALHDGHFEIVERPIGVPEAEGWFERPYPQVPQRAFTAVQDGKTGLLLANRGLPEVEVFHNPDGNAEIALTLLRCVGWLSRGDFHERGGHAGPGYATPGAQMKGRWAFDYAVVPFAAGEMADAIRQAYAFQAPMRAASTGLHAGALTGHASILRVESTAFVLSAVKAAEDGRGWIARGYSISDEEMAVTLAPLLSFGSAERVDLAERTVEPLAVRPDGSVRFTVQPGEIATVRFGGKG